MGGIELEPVPGEDHPAMVFEYVAKIDVAMGPADRNPAMPLGDQPFQRILGHAFEVQIVPGLADIGLASAKRDEGDLRLVQELEAGILETRRR
jgi:hypothetical protein